MRKILSRAVSNLQPDMFTGVDNNTSSVVAKDRSSTFPAGEMRHYTSHSFITFFEAPSDVK